MMTSTGWLRIASTKSLNSGSAKTVRQQTSPLSPVCPFAPRSLSGLKGSQANRFQEQLCN